MAEYYWKLPSGKTVCKWEVDKLEDKETVKELVGVDPSAYSQLKPIFRNNAEILASALAAYDRNYKSTKFGYNKKEYLCFSNPISYALEDALSSENIDSAIVIGGIVFDEKLPICRNREFVRKCLESGYDAEALAPALRNIDVKLKADPIIAEMRYPIYAEYNKNHIDESNARSKSNFSESYTIILADGEVLKTESCGTVIPSGMNNNTFKEMVRSLTNIQTMNEESKERFSTMLEECEQLSASQYQRLKCSQMGLLSIYTQGNKSYLYLPPVLSESQYEVLISMITEDLTQNYFSISQGDKTYAYITEGFGHNQFGRELQLLDVLDIFEDTGLDNTVPCKEPVIGRRQMCRTLKEE